MAVGRDVPFSPLPSLPSSSLAAQPVSELWQRFELLDVIGEGSYGVVWRCRDRRSGQLRACKVQRKDAGSSKTLWREVDAMRRVGRHAHVVGLLGVYDCKDWLYLVMELCSARDLLQRVNETHGLPEALAARLFSQIVAGVQWCHLRGVVHRDIKPENILLTRRAGAGECEAEADALEVRLADFGLAVPVPPQQMLVGYAGSFPYEAPEVLAERPYDFSADVWSLGMLLYAMLSASLPPYSRQGGSSSRQFFPALHFKHPGWRSVSPEARDLIARMLAFAPAERPTTAEVLAHPWFAAQSEGLRRVVSLGTEEQAEERQGREAEMGGDGVRVARPATAMAALEGREGREGDRGAAQAQRSDGEEGGVMARSGREAQPPQAVASRREGPLPGTVGSTSRLLSEPLEWVADLLGLTDSSAKWSGGEGRERERERGPAGRAKVGRGSREQQPAAVAAVC